MTTRVDVAVVGGGIAGLTAAALVAREGRSVVVLEKAADPGGRARSRTLDGFTLNLGPHAVYRRGPGMAVLETLGVKLRGRPPVSSYRAEAGGREDVLPVDLATLWRTTLLAPADKLSLAWLMSRLPRLDPRPLDGVTVADWLAGQRPGAAAMMRAMARLATYVNDPRQSAGAAVRQLQDAMATGVLYLDGGWQQLVDALRARALEAGALLRTHAGVRALRGNDVQLEDETIHADAIVLAVPPETVAELVPSLRNAVDALVPSRAACLDVALRRLPRPDRPFLMSFDEPFYASVHSLAAQLAPEGGALVHLARYLGSEAPAQPAAVRAQLEDVLDRLQPGWRVEVVHARFLPDMVVTHDVVRAEAGGLKGRVPVDAGDGVLLAGDWVGDEGQLAHASLASARTAAGLAVQRTAASRAA